MKVRCLANTSAALTKATKDLLFDGAEKEGKVKYDLQESLVQCAARSNTLRQHLGITAFQIYGYPLTSDGF